MIERTVYDTYSGKTKCPECGGGDLLYFEQPALERVGWSARDADVDSIQRNTVRLGGEVDG